MIPTFDRVVALNFMMSSSYTHRVIMCFRCHMFWLIIPYAWPHLANQVYKFTLKTFLATTTVDKDL